MSSFIIYSFLILTITVSNIVNAGAPPKHAPGAPGDDAAAAGDAKKDDAPKTDDKKEGDAAAAGDDKKEGDAAAAGDDKKEGDAAAAGSDKKEGDAAAAGDDKKEGDAAAAGGDKKEGDAAAAGDDKKEGDAAAAGGDKKEGDAAAAGGDKKEGDAAAGGDDAKKDGDAAKAGDDKKDGDAGKEGDAKKDEAPKAEATKKDGDAGGDGGKPELTNDNAAQETLICIRTSSAYVLDNLISGATPYGDAVLNCPAHFIQLADSCYHFGGNYLFSTNYADAKKHCKELEGDLVHIENKHEFEALFQFADNLPSTIAYKEITHDVWYFWTSGKWDGKKWLWGNKKPVQGYWCEMGNIIFGNMKVLTFSNAEYGGCYKSENEQIMTANYICEAKPIK